jgi:hypothetical protein
MTGTLSNHLQEAENNDAINTATRRACHDPISIPAWQGECHGHGNKLRKICHENAIDAIMAPIAWFWA